MWSQSMSALGMLQQQQYDQLQQARQGLIPYGAVGGGGGSLYHAAMEEQRRTHERVELARNAEAERAEHNRKLLLLED